jgi:signal transduction histidine kinase
MVYYVGSQRDITRQKELDRMKDQFVSDVSHELRTPTTNISLYLELMDQASTEKRTEYLAVLKDQGYQLRKLVEDILDLSRLSMGRERKIEFGPVNINLVAAQVITAHQPLADATGLSLDFLASPELPPVRGEENQLARVITNLVSNAVRYTDQGSVNVRTYHNGQRVCLEVQDTGMGIDPEDRPHLFERFYRGRSVRQTRIHGTGLGLAIVKEIVDLHGGYINVNSYPGEGSTFQVWFPMYMD